MTTAQEVRERHGERRNDEATHLPMQDKLLEKIERCLRLVHVVRIAVFFFDLDRFKSYNTAWGPMAADELIRQVASRLKTLKQEGEHIFRPYGKGGDEFVVVMVNPATPQDAVSRAFEIAGGLHEAEYAVVIDPETTVSVPIRISGGVSWWEGQRLNGLEAAAEAERLLEEASNAQVLAKQGAPIENLASILRFSAPVWREHKDRQSRYHKYAAAIHAGQTGVRYQPIRNLVSGSVYGFEMLLAPLEEGEDATFADVIADLEEAGHDRLLWEDQVRRACLQLRRWNHSFGSNLVISINITSTQLVRTGAIEFASRIASEAGVMPAQLCFEIIERKPIPPRCDLVLHGWRQSGFGLVLDDLTGGHNSLVTLRHYGHYLTGVKLDASLIGSVDSDPYDRLVTEKVIEICHLPPQPLPVTAEGVQSTTLLEPLRKLGCARVQGFALGVKLTAEEAEALLTAPSPW